MNILDSSAASSSSNITVTGPFVWTVTGDLKHGVALFTIDIGGGPATALAVSNETIRAGKLDFPNGSILKVTLSGAYGDCLVDILYE